MNFYSPWNQRKTYLRFSEDFRGNRSLVSRKISFEIRSKIWRRSLNHFRPNPGWREKIELNFYFHTSLWCIKRTFKALIKPFEASQRSVKKINFIVFISIQLSEMHGTGRVKTNTYLITIVKELLRNLHSLESRKLRKKNFSEKFLDSGKKPKFSPK